MPTFDSVVCVGEAFSRMLVAADVANVTPSASILSTTLAVEVEPAAGKKEASTKMLQLPVPVVADSTVESQARRSTCMSQARSAC